MAVEECQGDAWTGCERSGSQGLFPWGLVRTGMVGQFWIGPSGNGCVRSGILWIGSQGSFSPGMVRLGEEGIGYFSPGLTGKEDNDRQRATGLRESRTEEKQRTLFEMEKGNEGNE